MSDLKMYAYRSKINKTFVHAKTIDEIVNKNQGQPVEVFETVYRSIGHFKKKETYEKCEPLPVAVPHVGENIEEEEEEDDDELEDCKFD